MSVDSIQNESFQIFNSWITSCTRGGKLSRNTIAIGIVVFHHLLKSCPVSKHDVISKGGEIKGARSGLGKILETYGIPRSFLKEATTRQGHQDGQRLFTQFDWGTKLSRLTQSQREQILNELIDNLFNYAIEWLNRQSLKLDIDRRQTPSAWINIIIQNAQGHSGGVVEQHLVGAKLQRRFSKVNIPNHPAHAADLQTSRAGDFEIANLVYHVTASPSRNVIRKCAENIRSGLHPILLIPISQETKAAVLSQDEGLDKQLTIISIENFVAMNIIELATDENKNFFNVLEEIIDIYNNRLTAVETDLSLKIQVR